MLDDLIKAAFVRSFRRGECYVPHLGGIIGVLSDVGGHLFHGGENLLDGIKLIAKIPYLRMKKLWETISGRVGTSSVR